MRIVNQYLIYNFLKVIGNAILLFICLGVIFNLFEEIEFFKQLNVNISLPLTLTLMFIPNLMIKLLPFIIFFASVWYLLSLKNNKDLISLKVFGYSNLKIISILSLTAFFFGLVILFAFNPLSSSMIKYYEKTKSEYSRDIEHLVSINKNGVWIKEKVNDKLRIISAKQITNDHLIDLTIYELDEGYKVEKRIESEKANIVDNNWFFEKVTLIEKNNEITTYKIVDNYLMYSNYNLEKLNDLYKNLDTVSFLSLITNYKELHEKGYPKHTLNEQINKFISLPFFLLLMVVLASIFTIGSNNKNQNIYYIFISIITCVLIYYFKDFSLALALTNRISLELAVWMPILAISLFCAIGVLQINEK